jgi:chemotaxis protein methyltransferase CheR
MYYDIEKQLFLAKVRTLKNETENTIAMMYTVSGRDLAVYDESFLEDSLERRRQATGIDSASGYVHFLEENEKEAESLLQSLTITFSQFFRDPLTYSILEQQILPQMICRKSGVGEIRIWSAGCASGQEAYTMAMILSDLGEATGKPVRFRIFATDVSEEALIAARTGIYDKDAMQNVTSKRVADYFCKKGTQYSIIPQLKNHVFFSKYDLLDALSAHPAESIFGDFDIVICSNLLFYYKKDLQIIIMDKLKKSMSANGVLVTGETEKSFIEKSSKMLTVSISSPIFEKRKP